MDTIKVNIDRENNCISVYNNGRGIPIEIHAKEGVYVPEVRSCPDTLFDYEYIVDLWTPLDLF